MTQPAVFTATVRSWIEGAALPEQVVELSVS